MFLKMLHHICHNSDLDTDDDRYPSLKDLIEMVKNKELDISIHLCRAKPTENF